MYKNLFLYYHRCGKDTEGMEPHAGSRCWLHLVYCIYHAQGRQHLAGETAPAAPAAPAVAPAEEAEAVQMRQGGQTLHAS